MGEKVKNRDLVDEIIRCQQSNEHPNEVSPILAKMLLTMCVNLSWKANFRGYTYREDFIAEAMVHCITPAKQGDHIGVCPVLQFNPERYAELMAEDGKYRFPNAFAWCTQIIKHVFVRMINREKRQRDIKDDLLEIYGMNPSYTRMLSNEDNRSSEPIEVKEPKPPGLKPGRKPNPKPESPEPKPKRGRPKNPNPKPKPEPKPRPSYKVRCDNKSGHPGVIWRENSKKWQATLHTKKGNLYLGTFTDYDSALAARIAAEIEYGLVAREFSPTQ